MIYTGSNEILGVKLGNADINAIYAGDLLIYPTTVTGWSVNPSSIEAETSGGTATIRITSLSAWSISSSESWITFSQNSGESGRTSVIVTFEENGTGEERYATITATDGTNTSDIAITQIVKSWKWLPVTEDFDKSLVIKKWRFDVSIPISGNYDGALSELPNIDIKTCWNNSKPENGYAFSNRFNLGQDYFSNRYYGFTDGKWTATTSSHTTLVEGSIYEFECPVDLYWAGNRTDPWNPNIPNYMWFYVYV